MQQDDSIVIRDMKPGEEKELLRAARQAFSHSPMEQIAISQPKNALVVEADGELAGALFLRVFTSGEKKMGYLDVGFVVKEYRGRGIGRILYPAAISRLYEMGCDKVSAMVIDDNTASWKSLENQGFGAPSLTELVRLLGFTRAVSLWFQTVFCFASGARLWLSGPVKKRRSVQELVSFLLVNIVLFLPGMLRLAAQPDKLALTLAAYPCVLLFGVFVGGVGCLIARGSWRFSFTRGGLLLSLILNTFGVVFPMVGRWYQKSPQATKECRRALGVQAATEWTGMLLLFALGALLTNGDGFFYHCAALAANLLVYRLIPFMPFGSFGGGRVWAWNKLVYTAFAVATIVFLAIVLI